jgi:hypothetical protein
MIEADLAGQEKMSDLAVKYAAALKALKEKTVVPKRGKLDSGGWIDHLPDCYSDFSPHFNPERRLSNLYVGSTSGWRLKYSSTPSPSHETRNVYEAQAPFQTVSFKVLVKNPLGVKINVCAFPVTHGLNTVTFGLDLNVAQWDTLSSTSNYMPTDKADFNTSARNSGSDCRMIGLVNHGGQVPAGKHVLHAKTTSRGTAAVSYVVVMNNNIN